MIRYRLLHPPLPAALSAHRHGGGQRTSWEGVERFAFCEACHARSVSIVIATGETRPYSNLLLTVGVP